MTEAPICEHVVERIQLQLQRIAATRAIPLSLDNIRVRAYIDREAGAMILQLNASLYEAAHASHTVEVTAEVRIPATWIDSFKERFQQMWWMRLWIHARPIRYKTVARTARETVTVRALLPDVPPTYGEHAVLYFIDGGEQDAQSLPYRRNLS